MLFKNFNWGRGVINRISEVMIAEDYVCVCVCVFWYKVFYNIKKYFLFEF